MENQKNNSGLNPNKVVKVTQNIISLIEEDEEFKNLPLVEKLGVILTCKGVYESIIQTQSQAAIMASAINSFHKR